MIALLKALKRALRELEGHGGKYSLEYGSIQLPQDCGTCHIHASCYFLIIVLGLSKTSRPHVPVGSQTSRSIKLTLCRLEMDP